MAIFSLTRLKIQEAARVITTRFLENKSRNHVINASLTFKSDNDYTTIKVFKSVNENLNQK